jgi:hypothetical protein
MVGGNVIGFMLNRVNPKKNGGSIYGYKSYGYSHRYYKNYYNRYETKSTDEQDAEDQKKDAE